MIKNKTLKGYNPSNRGAAFNEDYGRTVWTETATDITPEEKHAAQIRQAKMIERIQKELSNE